MTALAEPANLGQVHASRRRRGHRRRAVIGILLALVLAGWVANVMVGESLYSPLEVLRVLLGEATSGAEFIIGLRLPRASMAVVAGMSFGLAGVTFQTLLRNPLASPDIIGITQGASAAAVVSIVTFGLSGLTVSAVAVVAGLAVALAVYLLAYRNGVADSRLILIGIGVAAMMQSVVTWQLERASNAEIALVLRWLTGSLNGADWDEVLPVLAALLVLGTLMLTQQRGLSTAQLGNDAAAALGVRVERMRFLTVVSAVGLICLATAVTGPIAFLAFLSGPIAARIVKGAGSLLLPAALVGAVITLAADLCGQYALGVRLPVGVVTGVLGAPYLLYLIVRINRRGGSL